MVKLQTELVETKPEWIEMYQIKFQFATRATLVSSSEIEERWVEGDWPAFDSMFRIAWATTSPFYRDRFSSWGKTTKPFSLSYPEWDEMYLSWGWAYLRPSSGRPQEGRWKYNVSFVVIFLKIITKLSNEINSHLHDMIWLKLRTKFKYINSLFHERQAPIVSRFEGSQRCSLLKNFLLLPSEHLFTLFSVSQHFL